MAHEVSLPRRDKLRATARRQERDDVLRLCAWGGSAVVAVAAFVLTAQSDIGGRRIETLFNGAPSAPPAVIAAPISPRAPEKDPETLRLQAEVRTLAADRERLAKRLAALEQNLSEVTGSIQRQAAAPPPSAPPPLQHPPVAAAPPPAPISPPAVTAVASVSHPAPAPTATPVPVPAAVPTIPTISPLAMPVIENTGGWHDSKQDRHDDGPAATALESHDVAAVPGRLAGLPATESAADTAATAARIASKTEYGIDLGGAANMDALRTRWTTIKANLGPLLSGLQPVAVRSRKPGSTELRLVVGPMPNLAAAQQVCTRFASSHIQCQATKFDGESIVQR